MPFTWIQYSAARDILAQRLADPNKLFWTDAELGLYLIESLRTWNALTEIWNSDFEFQANSAAVWYDLSSFPGSPRLKTVQDLDLYTIMQYHLLEQPSGGGPWTGTSQFSLADLQGALQRRRDEVIQTAGCNLSEVPPLPSTPNTFRVVLNDSTLEARRIRFIPDSSSQNFGPPITLTREDREAFDTFEYEHWQETGMPSSFSLIAGPPLMFDTDVAPNVPGTFDLIALLSGKTFNPPLGTLLGIPDDWCWVAKWGALSDLLSRESEATDRLRAQFCLERYLDGLKAIGSSNWILGAKINGVVVDTPSVAEMDNFSPEWQENETWPSVVVAGMDFIAPCPVATKSVVSGVEVTVVGNAPIPVLDSDYVQVSRDNFDTILAYAQVLAMFKMGGSEFTDGKQLLAEFANAAATQNQRILNLGIFGDVLRSEGKRQDRNQSR